MSDETPVQVEVVEETVPAQVAPPREPDSDTVEVHETSVRLDRVITDPSSPEAVQVPEEGRGSLDLPIHKLNAQSPEQVLANSAPDEPQEPEPTEEASQEDQSPDVEPEPPVEPQPEVPEAPQADEPAADDDDQS